MLHPPATMSADKHLNALFDADRAAHQAEATLLEENDDKTLQSTLADAVDEALGLDDEAEAAMRLSRLADLCAQVQGAKLADALIRILGFEDNSVRVSAGEALRDFAYDRYAEVARAIERALEKEVEGPALEELPWVLAEVGEPSAVPLIASFLEHEDPQVVASGIEALAELGDPGAAKPLSALKNDGRVVQLEEGDVTHSATLGELAEEALAELGDYD